MRWICKHCHHHTASSWCFRCRRNTGAFTDAELGEPITTQIPREDFSQSEKDAVVKRAIEAFGGKDPGAQT